MVKCKENTSTNMFSAFLLQFLLYTTLFQRNFRTVGNTILSEDDLTNNSSPRNKPFIDVTNLTGRNSSKIKNNAVNGIGIEGSTEFAFSQLAQNSGISNGVTEEEADVFTLMDTTTEIDRNAEIVQEQTSSQVESSNAEEENYADDNSPTPQNFEMLTKDDFTDNANVEELDSEGVPEDNVTGKTENLVVDRPKENLTEEIPSFSEWAQKQLEQAEKNKEQVNSSTQSSQINGKSVKKRSKNYASPDCGAKIIAANPEAISPGSVLSSSRDEYKLNKCTSRIWFIVELCEAIQAKQIDLANFELFSSSPKDFSIYVSDRFPTRDWSNVGHFTAKDERDIQTFDLHPYLFGKFIKFEMHTHHGSEHYCPISLFRVFGTSEFEVLQTEEQTHSHNIYDEDDDDETLDFDHEDVPRNLLSSATDAVISIVKKAAQVLGKKGNISNETVTVGSNKSIPTFEKSVECVSPTHILVCNNCSDEMYADVYNIISCQSRVLHALISNENLKIAFKNLNLCSNYGLNFYRNGDSVAKIHYLVLMFLPPKYVAALCNILAVLENKVVRNSTVHCFNCTKSLPKENNDKTFQGKMENIVESALSSQKNLKKEDEMIDSEEKRDLNLSSSHVNKTDVNLKNEEEITDLSSNFTSALDSSQIKHDKNLTNAEINLDSDVSNINIELDESLENFSSEGIENQGEVHVTTVPPVGPQSQNKESVFVRLTNRIKALERNMSLSSQYLEELSKRYKKQVEEMQRLLDKTITNLNEENFKNEKRTQKLEDQLTQLTAAIEVLLAERNFWLTLLYWLLVVLIISLFLCLFCGRNFLFRQSSVGLKETTEAQFGNANDINVNKTLLKKKRRRSEDILNTGYQHLLIEETEMNEKRKDKKKKRKKSHTFVRSKSTTTLAEEVINEEHKYRTIHTEVGFPFMKLPENKMESLSSCNYEPDYIPNKIQDVPFVLDEKEYTGADPFIFSEYKMKPNINDGCIKENNYPVQALTSRIQNDGNLKSNSKTVKNNCSNHKKSSSVDLTNNKKKKEILVDSLNSSEELANPLTNQRDKKGALKKILKSLSFKHKVNEVH
ncbi:SUN domain-containing ossification factor [Agrilus planipennis]|uniref:SUN domain-containing ossification factor n=1 Tax=Agrilus planipennis TaxID=224129 RepID=A0A1W4WPH4_AGRPL|nr:SUN domain-containing ossification factor [Agrilus planipennis]